ncbi:MAG TPA: PilZ domain-containing protein [Vicinamibacterales bacterium]|nr:PilZ domain-containing protein [Vicinamibacterales bacterium]
MTLLPRSERVAVAGAYAKLARSLAEVVNVSRTGVLIRGPQQPTPGDQWPLLLELGRTPLALRARVVRCEPVADDPRGRRSVFTMGLAFVDPSAEALEVLDRVCRRAARGRPEPQRRGTWLSMSLVRRCPRCRSRAVAKEGNRRYLCTACLCRFQGFRVGFIRFAR